MTTCSTARTSSFRWRRRAALVAAPVLALALHGTAPAVAQDAEDPYGPTSTTTTEVPPVEAEATCEVQLEAAVPGADGLVRIENGPAGVEVRILVGGTEAGRGTLPEAAEGEPAPPASIPFTVPELPDGDYPVSVVALDLTLECGVEGVADQAVQGVRIRRQAPATGGGSGGGAIQLPLPFVDSAELPATGVAVGVLVAMGLVLTVVGRSLVQASRSGRPARGRRGD